MYIQTFFVIFLIYKNLKQSNDWNKLINFLRISAIILCVYGIYNFITKSNPYDNFISNSFNSLSSFEFYKNIFDDRFRINSFVDHPIYYGYILAILFLLIFNALLTRRPKAIDIVILSLIFFNLILTNSRTPLFAFLFGCVIYISTSLNPKMKLLISVISVIFLMGLYAIPFIRDKMNNTIGIFEKEENQVGGSNLKMRQMQLLASYKLFSKKPISGNGLYYIEENLGYSSNEDKSTSADELQGFESYIYILLIEQGLIGIITNFIFFGAIIFYFIKNRKISKEFTGLGLAIAIMFLTFSIATGTLGSWIITMGILGIIIKIVELLKASKQYALKITN
ncbi:MAG: O-antigen ligase family protein [Ferruginibacter sp.]